MTTNNSSMTVAATSTAASTATSTAEARKSMISFWKAEVKHPASRVVVRSWLVTGSFRRQIKVIKEMAAREERRARRAQRA